MIDINPESSISTSHSNSILSKSSNTDDRAVDTSHSGAKRSVTSTRHDSDEAAISADIGLFYQLVSIIVLID